MTKSIEDALNLPPIKDVLPDHDEVDQVASALENIPSDQSFNDTGEQDHAKEMDDIIKLATSAHKSILDFGFNVEAKDAGKMFAEAAAHLDIALRASKSKSDAKAKIAQMKLNQDNFEKTNNLNVTKGEVIEDQSGQVTGRVLSRNDLIKQLREEIQR